MSKNLRFKVSSALKDVIGRDLITNDFVAIFELVKNAVDAGARKIDIVFELEKDNEQAIYVIDTGKGMSYQDIEDKWIFLAYSAKREGTEDSTKKVYAGNKGVGRFSCDRLGGRLHLQTRQENAGEVHNIHVNWGDFEKNSLDHFTKIDIKYESHDFISMPEGFKAPTHGMILKISELREAESWDRSKLLRLKSNLSKLVNPFGDRAALIKIKIHCARELDKDAIEQKKIDDGKSSKGVVNGSVKNGLIDLLKTKTTGLECEIRKDGYLYTELNDRGVMVYKTREPLSPDLQSLKDSQFSASIFFLNRSAKATFKRRMGITVLEFGSVFLYRNGFRVFPVGEEGDDSWGLNRRKQQGHSRYLGTRELMGRVDVHGSEINFRESSSRDKGLIETEASLALNECLLDGVRRLERYVVGISWRDQFDKEHDTPDRMFLAHNKARVIELVRSMASAGNAEILDYNRDLVSLLEQKSEEFEPSLNSLREVAERLDDADLIKKIRIAEQSLRQAKQDELEAMALAEREEAARLRADKEMAKVKNQMAVVQQAFQEEQKRNFFLSSIELRDKDQLEHFIHQMILYAAGNMTLLDEEIGKIKNRTGEDWRNTLSVLHRLREGMEKVITASRYMTRANFRMESGKIESDLAGFIKDHVNNVARFYCDCVVSTAGNDSGRDYVVSFSPIEMGMVIDNLISNSEKANATKVDFIIEVKGAGLSVAVTDDGDGLAADILSPSAIFEKGFTRTEGSGLGLHFCKGAVESIGGEITINPKQPARGFSLLLTFRSI